jgi:hypothetical protein
LGADARFIVGFFLGGVVVAVAADAEGAGDAMAAVGGAAEAAALGDAAGAVMLAALVAGADAGALEGAGAALAAAVAFDPQPLAEQDPCPEVGDEAAGATSLA